MDKIHSVVEHENTKLNSHPIKVETSASGIIELLESELDRYVNGAATALKKLNKYQKPSDGASSSFTRICDRLSLLLELLS